MDLLKGKERDKYVASALHLPRRPSTVYTANGDLFEDINDINNERINEFAARRSRNRRLATAAPALGGDVFAAIPRFYTPQDWFRNSHVPYDVRDDRQRFELYKWLDLFYRTHTLIPMLVDIFTRFPLVGIELKSQDDKLTNFYEDMFFERLDYEHFLVDLGREYWTLGQSFPLGHFNETLGVWEEEELLDPTLVKVKNYPIIGGREFFIQPPEDLIQIATKREPKEQFYLLQKNFPELIPYLLSKKDIPISSVLLRQVAFKVSPRDTHGTPLLLRALRTLVHEEKLMAAQDAVAERFYQPLILVKLGVQDMGEGRPPFLPGPGEIAQVRNEFDLALASDFRLMVHHFGIDVQSVFGREQMPRLGDDFDRIDRKLMAVFGINPSLLLGGAASQPYASSALQAEFLNQILRTYQGYLTRHYEARAKIVAEAQEHYAYEKRGDMRIPIMEEVLTYDEEGNEVIQTRHKLMIPDIRFKVLDLRDEATQRQFLQALRQEGVPLPDQDLAMGMHYDFLEALDKTQEEMIQKTVAQQVAKVKTYDILSALGAPIPPDLRAEVEGAGLGNPAPGSTTDVGVGAPGPGDQIAMPPPPDMGGGLGGGPGEGYSPERGTVPEQSSQAMGPQLPGVPGQPGLLGIPGAPQPAITPAKPPVKSSVSSFRESTNDDGEEILISELPRSSRGWQKIERLRSEDESATIETTHDEEA